MLYEVITEIGRGLVENFPGEQRNLAAGETRHHRIEVAADNLGLAGRGRIRPGAFADVAVFDAARIGSRATFETPAVAADGIELVVVNSYNFV